MTMETLPKNGITKTTGKTKFEEDLKVYFPEMYQFWALFSRDPFYEEVMQGIMEMISKTGYGTLEVVYNGGKINYVNLKRQLTANKSQRPEKIIRRQNES